MSFNKSTFKETESAAGLLNEFQKLMPKPVKRYTRSETEAARVFFNKDFLTIADFLAPIGEVLIVTSHSNEERTGSVGHFITTGLHRPKGTQKRPVLFTHRPETIAEFISRLDP